MLTSGQYLLVQQNVTASQHFFKEDEMKDCQTGR